MKRKKAEFDGFGFCLGMWFTLIIVIIISMILQYEHVLTKKDFTLKSFVYKDEIYTVQKQVILQP